MTRSENQYAPKFIRAATYQTLLAAECAADEQQHAAEQAQERGSL